MEIPINFNIYWSQRIHHVEQFVNFVTAFEDVHLGVDSVWRQYYLISKYFEEATDMIKSFGKIATSCYFQYIYSNHSVQIMIFFISFLYRIILFVFVYLLFVFSFLRKLIIEKHETSITYIFKLLIFKRNSKRLQKWFK